MVFKFFFMVFHDLTSTLFEVLNSHQALNSNAFFFLLCDLIIRIYRIIHNLTIQINYWCWFKTSHTLFSISLCSTRFKFVLLELTIWRLVNWDSCFIEIDAFAFIEFVLNDVILVKKCIKISHFITHLLSVKLLTRFNAIIPGVESRTFRRVVESTFELEFPLKRKRHRTTICEVLWHWKHQRN